jgi:hypothetical protein
MSGREEMHEMQEGQVSGGVYEDKKKVVRIIDVFYSL